MITPIQFELVRSFEAVARTLRRLTNFTMMVSRIDILHGELITVDFNGTSDTVINHKLGRTARGWLIASKNQDCRLWQTASNASSLTLRTSDAGTTASLWVF